MRGMELSLRRFQLLEPRSLPLPLFDQLDNSLLQFCVLLGHSDDIVALPRRSERSFVVLKLAFRNRNFGLEIQRNSCQSLDLFADVARRQISPLPAGEGVWG